MSPNIETSTRSTHRTRDASDARLRNIRAAVRGVLVLGLVASVASNILHAPDDAVSRTIAAWPPVALLLTVELISRVPVRRAGLAAVRLVATATIAGIAAWVSYWHMVAVVEAHGETGASPYLWPLTVDGLIVVASVCLVELADQIRAAETCAAPPVPVALSGGVRHDAPDELERVDAPVPDAPDELERVDAPDVPDELDARRRTRTRPTRRAGRRDVVADDELVAAITPYVLECRRAGVDPTQRGLIAAVKDATGKSVGWKRCVEAAELVGAVEDVEDATKAEVS